jgi:hypothetical protein
MTMTTTTTTTTTTTILKTTMTDRLSIGIRRVGLGYQLVVTGKNWFTNEADVEVALAKLTSKEGAIHA